MLADYTGNWEITNEVLSSNASKTFNRATFMPTLFGSPPLNFFQARSAHGNTRIPGREYYATVSLVRALIDFIRLISL